MIKRIIFLVDINLMLGDNYAHEMKENIKTRNTHEEKKYQKYKISNLDTIPTYNDKIINVLRKLSTYYELAVVCDKNKYINKIKNSKLNAFIDNYYNNYIDACSFNKTNECILVTDKYNNDTIAAKKIGINTILINQQKCKYVDINIEDLLGLSNELINKVDPNEKITNKKNYNTSLCQGIILGLFLGVVLLFKYGKLGFDISLGIALGIIISFITMIILKRRY